MAPTSPNPNWPTLFAEGEFGGNPYYQQIQQQAWTDLTPRLYKQWSVRRGKQFELDTVQPGELHGTLVNKDGALDPSNTGSFLQPVLPYRGFRMRAQYPSSVNLLNGDLATGGEVTPLSAGTTGTPYNLYSSFWIYQVATSGTAYQGTQVWQGTGTTTTANYFLYTGPLSIQAVQGTPYTFSIRVRSLTTGANPTVVPVVSWMTNTFNPVSSTTGSSTVLTGNPSAGWTTITYTDTVPGPSLGNYPNAVQFLLKVSATNPAGSWTVQMDGFQMEQASTASAFSVPGLNYNVFSGLVERFPQTWDYTGTYGLCTPICVDTMALLSQTILKEAYVMDLVATSPTWLFQLNDAGTTTGTSQTFVEQAGRTAPAGVFNSPYGSGQLTAGSSINATNLPSGKFYGTDGPVVTVNNTGLVSGAGSVVDLTPAGITSPPTSGGWTRALAFRCSTSITAGLPIIAAATSGYDPGGFTGYSSNWYMMLQNIGGSSMSVAVSMYTDSGAHAGLVGSNIVNDDNWHYAVFSLSADGLTLSLYIDGTQYQTTAAQDMHAFNTASEAIGGDMYRYSGLVAYGGGFNQFNGDIALYSQWNVELDLTTISNLYDSWRTGWQNDTSDQRYSRLLGWAGFAGAQNLDAGTTVNMGPANDINGIDALTCLQNVVNTEAGRHFIGSDGAANFQSRQRFFQSVTPMWTFGENQAGGEIPYVDIAFDYDPTRISNNISITQVSTGQFFNALDATSQSNYGTRNFSRSNQSNNAEEVRESAYYYLSRYKDPHLRIQVLKVDVASNPSLWSKVLQFELGQHVRINRRDQFGVRPTITMDGFIEQITHTGDDGGNWQTELQISPIPTTPYGTFTSLRTTLFSSAASGQKVVTINPLPDSATNPVRSELTDGQQMLIFNGATSEFVTIAVGGVQNQSAGYSSANLTMTTNLVNSYPSGANIVESSGSNYDSLAIFDTVQFAY